MTDRSKKQASNSNLKKFISKPTQKIQSPPEINTKLAENIIDSPNPSASSNPVPDSVRDTKSFSPVEVEHFDSDNNDQQKNQPQEPIILSTLRSNQSDMQKAENTNSVSDIVNYGSIDTQNAIKFLKEQDQQPKDENKPTEPKISDKKREILDDEHAQEIYANQAEPTPVKQAQNRESPEKNTPEQKENKLQNLEQNDNIDKSKCDKAVVFESYEDFLESLKGNENEFKPVIIPPPIVPPLPKENPTLSANIAPRKISTDINQEELKNKALALEKARLEAKEKQKKQELEEIKKKAKEKELQIKKKNSALKLQNIYRKHVLKKKLHELYSEAVKTRQLKIQAGRKIINSMKKYHEKHKKEELLKGFMNHCASIIQERYRKYKISQTRKYLKKPIKKIVPVQEISPPKKIIIDNNEIEELYLNEKNKKSIKQEEPIFDDEKIENKVESIQKPDNFQEENFENEEEELPNVNIRNNEEELNKKPIIGMPDDRPIKSLGKKSYDIDSALSQNPNEQQNIEEKPKEQKIVKKQFLKRKEVYNPRKAIENSKKQQNLASPEKIEKNKSEKNEEKSIKKEENKNENIEKETKINKKELPRTPVAKSSENEIENNEKQEKIDENENKIENENVLDDQGKPKPKREFLKRKTKKVEAKKVDFKKVPKRIDCWNPKSKESTIKEQKEIVVNKPIDKKSTRGRETVAQRSNKQPKMARPKTGINLRKKAEYQEDQKRGPKRGKPQSIKSRSMPRKMPMQNEQDDAAPRLSVQELTQIYNQYHGDEQSIFIIYYKL